MTRPASIRPPRDQIADAASAAASLVAISVERATGRTVPGEVKARLRDAYHDRILADAMRLRVEMETERRAGR